MNENAVNQRSLKQIDRRISMVKSDKVSKDIGSHLKQQKEEIKSLMLETNKVFTGFRHDPYHF